MGKLSYHLLLLDVRQLHSGGQFGIRGHIAVVQGVLLGTIRGGCRVEGCPGTIRRGIAQAARCRGSYRSQSMALMIGKMLMVLLLRQS